MSHPIPRSLILTGVLLLAAWLVATTGRPTPPSEPRWPAPHEEGVWQIEGWTREPGAVQTAWGVTHVQHTYRHASGTVASVTLSTSAEGKGIFGKAEVPFQGQGYTVGEAPKGLVPPGAPRKAVIARGNDASWLLLYAYGDRRGPVPSTIHGWGLLLLDGVLGHDNDYYLIRVGARLDPAGGHPADQTGAQASLLADTLIARLSSWYAGDVR